MLISLKAAYFEIEDEIVSLSGKSYELRDRIGSGGNGAVYECIDSSGSIYAVKFLLQLYPKSKKRFEQEVSLLERINHPHIIRYIDKGKADAVNTSDKSRKAVELPFVVMERADGNLIDYLRNVGAVPYEIYAAQFRGLCEALAEIHKVAIHRDIKPENVLIKGEAWVLSDFGLCTFLAPEEHKEITKENEKVGPAFWMSPEAVDCSYFQSNLIGTYSDVFQLCAVFAFVLTKRFPGGIIQESNDLNTTPEIRDVLIRSLSNDYAQRPADGSALVAQYNIATYMRA